MILAGVNEGLLPFKAGDEGTSAERLQEERRLMYVGITRGQDRQRGARRATRILSAPWSGRRQAG